MKTTQEIFDNIVNHLRTQGTACVDEHGMCAYRGPKNGMCAVGSQIEDKDYSEEMEGFDVNEIYQMGLLPDYLVNHIPILVDLQRFHDDKLLGLGRICDDSLAVIAKKHDITYIASSVK